MTVRDGVLVMVLALGGGGCFVGYPPDRSGVGGAGDLAEHDAGFALADPPCDAASIEPDDGERDDEFSQIGAVTTTVRTFCGHIAKASNDGTTYTGDVDIALIQTLDVGRVSLVLSWDNGKTAVDVALNTDITANTWVFGDDGVIEERLQPDFYTVLIAGVDGPATDYQLDVWLE